MMQAIRFNGTLNLTVNGNPLKKGKEVDALKAQYGEQVTQLADEVTITVDRSHGRNGVKETVRLDVGPSTHWFKKGDLTKKMTDAMAQAPQVFENLKATGWVGQPSGLLKDVLPREMKNLENQSVQNWQIFHATLKRIPNLPEKDVIGILLKAYTPTQTINVSEEKDPYTNKTTQTVKLGKEYYTLTKQHRGQLSLESHDYRRLDDPPQAVLKAFESLVYTATTLKNLAKQFYDASGFAV